MVLTPEVRTITVTHYFSRETAKSKRFNEHYCFTCYNGSWSNQIKTVLEKYGEEVQVYWINA